VVKWDAPGWVDLERELCTAVLLLEHVHDMGQQELAQVTQAIEAETVRHDLAGQAVPPEQRLHAVGYLNLHMVEIYTCNLMSMSLRF